MCVKQTMPRRKESVVIGQADDWSDYSIPDRDMRTTRKHCSEKRLKEIILLG